MSFLKENNGKTSGKRVAGFLCIAFCLLFAFIDQVTVCKANTVIFNTVFFGGLALLGSTLVPKKEEENKND